MAANVSDRISDDVIVWLENENEATANIPAICFSLSLMITGLIGNGFAVYAYGFCFKKTSANVYTYWLAICDICCCVVNIPFEVFQIRYPLVYGEAISCKVFRTVALMFYSWEGLLLLYIAFDRYIKICKPMKRSGRRSAKRPVLITFMAGGIVSLPAIFVYGHSSVETQYTNIHGNTCSVAESLKFTIFPGLFFGYLLFLAVGGLIVLLFFYSNIYIMVRQWRHRKISRAHYISRLNSKSSILSELSVNYNPKVDIDRVCVIGTPELLREDERRNSRFGSGRNSTNLIGAQSSIDIEDDDHLKTRSSIKRQVKIAKTTFIFIVVTVTFVLSYLPYIIISIILKTNSLVLHQKDTLGKMLTTFGIKLYCINNASNPIIYSIFNRDFRKACTALFTSTETVNKKIIDTEQYNTTRF